MSDATLYLVCGLPGAGKTTRAREILEHTKAVPLNPDDWIVGLGVSLVDYEFQFRLRDVMLTHAADLLRRGLSVVVEFGSWSREEREGIRQIAVRARSRTELHFVDAPLDELARFDRYVGPDAFALFEPIGRGDRFCRRLGFRQHPASRRRPA